MYTVKVVCATFNAVVEVAFEQSAYVVESQLRGAVPTGESYKSWVERPDGWTEFSHYDAEEGVGGGATFLTE